MSIELRPVKELPKLKRELGSEYDKILGEFIESGEKYAEVIPKKEIKLESLASSLRNRISKRFKGKIKVRTREGKLYLERIG